MTTVLLTGFEPFGGDPSNPSGDAVRLVAAAWTGPETLLLELAKSPSSPSGTSPGLSFKLRKKVLPGNPRQARTNYRCSDQGLAGFACRTSTAPDSPERQNQWAGLGKSFYPQSTSGGGTGFFNG